MEVSNALVYVSNYLLFKGISSPGYVNKLVGRLNLLVSI